MNSLIQFALLSFLILPAVVVALIVCRKNGFPPSVAPIGLLPIFGVAVILVFRDDGSLGVFGFGAAVVTLVGGLRGVFELLRELKRRASKGPMSLLDERERR